MTGTGRTVAASLVLGAGITWNMANVGAVADPLAAAYGVSLAVVGLLTTALVLTHFLVQLPAGRGADRVGARTIGIAAAAAAAAGNALALVAPDPGVAVAARLLTGIGSGAGFVAGAELMRSARPSPLLQGLYGGATMAGGGLAVAVVPLLEGSLGWRAPYWSGLAIALAVGVVLLGAPRAARAARGAARPALDRRLLPLAAVHTATFGLSVVAANWVVALLERHGHGRTEAAVTGALVLLAGIVTRPLGGLLARQAAGRVRAVVGASLALGAFATLALALPLPLPALVAATAVAGAAAGLPFAAVVTAAQRLLPEAPAAALGSVNACATFAILVGTPLAGLAFDLPGEGRLAFAALAGLWATALLAVRRAPF